MENNPLLLDYKAVCQLLSIRPTHFFDLRASGKFPVKSVRLGRSVRYPRAEIERWVEAGCPVRWGDKVR